MIDRLLRWIEQLPRGGLVVFAAVMLGAPFVPEPHLVEKARMLVGGALTRPLDLFDVLWHLLPTVLLGVQWARRCPMRNSAR